MKRRPAPDRVSIAVTVESRLWARALPRAAALCRKAARAALGHGANARRLLRAAPAAELGIVLTSDAAVRRLNAAWRGKDTPTNVLSFPAADGGARPPGAPLLLGDVVVAYGTTARESRLENKMLGRHLSHLVVHGVLHLLGYDHQQERDARIMERLEVKILSTLGIPDPYRAPPRRKRTAP